MGGKKKKAKGKCMLFKAGVSEDGWCVHPPARASHARVRGKFGAPACLLPLPLSVHCLSKEGLGNEGRHACAMLSILAAACSKFRIPAQFVCVFALSSGSPFMTSESSRTHTARYQGPQ